jgi:NADPH:quinone reductase
LGRMVELLGKKHRIPVINIVRKQSQADLLNSTGSKYVLDSSDPGFFENLRELSLKLNATILFDSVCDNHLGNIIEQLPFGSSVVIYGNLSLAQEIKINPRSLIDSNINISGFYLGRRSIENGMFKNLLNLREVSRLMSSDMKIRIGSKFPMSRAQEAVDTYLVNMSAGKVLLVMG